MHSGKKTRRKWEDDIKVDRPTVLIAVFWKALFLQGWRAGAGRTSAGKLHVTYVAAETGVGLLRIVCIEEFIF